MTNEEIRLAGARDRTRHWKRWGPYLSERAWGTVREDYSSEGNAWDFFPHDHARSRAYRWNEDGIAGISDRRQFICFAVALWNEHDPILKERLFGLSGTEGNHGEDVKEYYFYLDSTPTHSYMKYLYKYPQAAFPYAQLVEENRRRSKNEAEYELLDTGVFDEDRYFDVFVEYAKGDVEDILIKITVANRGPESAPLHLLPTIWFRNTWSWDNTAVRPSLRAAQNSIELNHPALSMRWLYHEGSAELLFTENETNTHRLFNAPESGFCKKDAINDYIVHGIKQAVSAELTGTKAAAHYAMEIAAGKTASVRLRLTNLEFKSSTAAFTEFDDLFAARKREADEFYATIIPKDLSLDAQNVMRQGFAGLLWSKQFYHYVVKQWLQGDPGNPPPPAERTTGRNHDWPHLYNSDVISMPDKWEYPWYAAWDLAFHCVSLALVDPDFAKDQLVLLLREWYMHPNGQLPAYEWALGDVNPPVHAWAAWRVYKIDKKKNGRGDREFLVRVFHKLLLNFTWWVNRKDAEGMNIFQGGFLGLDNIGVFNRSDPLPTGGHIEQSDGTSWMAMYTLNLLAIAMELAMQDPAYEDVASKFWEHFIYIAYAMNHLGQDDMGLWDEKDGFFYDGLKFPDGGHFPVKIRSMVGLIPLFAVETLEPELLHRLPGFKRRMEWFIENRPDLTQNVASMRTSGMGERRLLAIIGAEQLRRLLQIMLDEEEFLSPHGIRALSRYHRDRPFTIAFHNKEHRVDYEPGESTTGLFGGNSNWRGPVWFPVNYLLIESLQKFHHYFGDDLKVEFPSRSGKMLTLSEVATEISRRLSGIFLRGENGLRPVYQATSKFSIDHGWNDLILFYEYFHGDTGQGLGASHQTGWTALVTKLLQQTGHSREFERRRK
ncbi:MAG: glucosidase [Candidatus Sulfotelmatobacter sp.]|jgi:mannosylglycerate hydrolase MGH1-like protein/glycosyl hydrolase family 63